MPGNTYFILVPDSTTGSTWSSTALSGNTAAINNTHVSSYIFTTQNFIIGTYTFSDFTPTDAISITGIKLNCLAWHENRTGTWSLKTQIKNGDGDVVNTTTQDVAVGTSLTPAWYSTSLITNIGGDAFTDDDDSTSGLDSLTLVLSTASDPAGTAKIASAQLIVYYEIPTYTSSDEQVILDSGKLEFKNGMTVIGSKS